MRHETNPIAEADPLDHAILNAQMEYHSMTGNALCSRGIIRKGKVPEEGTDCHCKHDHPVVGHEKKPIAGQQSNQRPWARDTHMMKKL